MSSVKIDTVLNRLTITITAATREELSEIVADIKAAAHQLEPDLTCLTDFRNIWSLLPENGDLLEKAQRYLLKIGVGKTVRVLNPEQFNTPAYELLDKLPTGYRFSYANSMEEGVEILDNFRQELIQGTKNSRKRKGLFKYMDRSGWEQDAPAPDFDSTLKRLKKLRKKGRNHAIIVDIGFKQRA